MKISKLSIIVLIAILCVIGLATTASAYTSNDLSAYLTGSHKIGGESYEFSSFQKDDINFY